MLDVQRLRVFRAVVASGSVQAAADHLGYTPSAVSQHLTALQRETGLVLFEKAGRGIAPTPTAKVLAAESDELMGSLTRLGGVVDHLREGRSGSVTIGDLRLRRAVWLPHVAQGLQRDFPDVVLELSLDELGPRARPTRPAATSRSPTRPPTGPASSGPATAGWCSPRRATAVVAPRGHELLERVRRAGPDGARSPSQPMVDNDFHHTGCSRIIRNACRAAGFTPRFVARSDDHHTALAFVAGGIGVTILPTSRSRSRWPASTAASWSTRAHAAGSWPTCATAPPRPRRSAARSSSSTRRSRSVPSAAWLTESFLLSADNPSGAGGVGTGVRRGAR